jgi:hypothetical protein
MVSHVGVKRPEVADYRLPMRKLLRVECKTYPLLAVDLFSAASCYSVGKNA